MTTTDCTEQLLAGLESGDIVPYIGPGVLSGVTEVGTDEPIPADGNSLILAMNDGRPMAPRLMYEFPRAAMNLELKKGRKFIEKFLTKTYGERTWNPSPFHQWLFNLSPKYIIDINRDTQLQTLYSNAKQPFTLIVGVARIGGTDFRYKIFEFDGAEYQEKPQEAVNQSLPILFKPMGSPLPTPNFIASDADYVDYITELMGGFGVPAFLKEYRKNKRYAFMGMDLSRDTERMVMSDIIYGAATDPCGWVLNSNANAKEQRYFGRRDLTLLDIDWEQLMESAASESVA